VARASIEAAEMIRNCTEISILKKTILYADLIHRLDLRNVAYVSWYRFSLKTGMRRWFFPLLGFNNRGDFFRPLQNRLDRPDEWNHALIADAEQIAGGHLRYYSRRWWFTGSPPDWFLNPFNGARNTTPGRHWTALNEFDVDLGDIKNIWEASRFEWVLALARAYAVSGEPHHLQILNEWLQNWTDENPVNAGPNWKCGQEASIRVFNLVNAALVLQQWDQPSPALMEFIFHHLERIHGNIRYAVSQDNNHGTSEAAALFIGGNWLARVSGDKAVARKSELYARSGKKWLENRVEKLVEADGSFSQHSVTYHRVLLDTLIYAEYWRKKLNAKPFSVLFYERSAAALDWMAAIIDPVNGDAPNLGANDGAMLLNMHACNYRDFRPTLQTASVLFCGRKFFDAGPWDEPLFWLGIDASDAVKSELAKQNKVFAGGYVIMAAEASWALLRFPMYRFRPSHNDVFHFDLWYQGQNICRDAGSFSYNPDEEDDDIYFKSVRAHNTVCFDGQDQMPRLGRFLLGRWIQADHVGKIEAARDGCRRWSGVYTDWRGNKHRRAVFWSDDQWVVEDDLAGPFNNAEIRFRLAPGEYRLEGNRLIGPWGWVEVYASDCRMCLEIGMESLYYQEKSPVDVLVISIGRGRQQIKTKFSLQ